MVTEPAGWGPYTAEAEKACPSPKRAGCVKETHYLGEPSEARDDEDMEGCVNMVTGIGGCSVSRWRPHKVDKRMVLEYTHGLFIT
jgi:hypothetical protein